MMKKCVHVQISSGAACIGDWGRANLWKGFKVPLYLIEMIRELPCGVNGFSMTEIIDILAYISTN